MVAHAATRPAVGTLRPPHQLGVENGMAVAEDIGPYFDGLSGDPFDRETANVDSGINVFDEDGGGD
jgi:hypothetical protein